MIDINKALGLYSMDEVLEHTKPYLEDNYTGTYIYELKELYRTHLFLHDWEDSYENSELFLKKLEYYNFPLKVAII